MDPYVDTNISQKHTVFIFSLKIKTPDIVVEWLTLLLRIPEFPGSNLGPETGYLEVFRRGFPQSVQANAGVVLTIRPRPLPSKSFTIHNSLITLSFSLCSY
jgi:hypothetical protein